MSHVRDHESVKIIERCQVSPPQNSIPTTSIPISFLDIPWLYISPIQRIFFHEFPFPTQTFLQTLIPKLKHSLSITLQHFIPFASNLVYPPKPHFPYFLYQDGDSIPFTIAESTTNFDHLISDSPKHVTDLHPFVPTLFSPHTSEDGTRYIPLMAIQVTILPNNGFALCVSFHHVVGDGRAFHHFMKFWSSLCSKNGDSTSLEASVPLPFHNRDIIQDPKGLLKLKMMENMWNSPTPSKEFAVVYTDMVRATFVLNPDQIERLKKWVIAKCSNSDHFKTLHISTFVVTSSLIWVCFVRSEEIIGYDVPNDDELYHLIFLADCRNHHEVSIPSTYFGNCLGYRTVTMKRSELVGNNAIVEAVRAIECQVRDVQSDPFKGLDTMTPEHEGRVVSGHGVVIASSPKQGVYETNFGSGKPKMTEVVHIDSSKSIAFSDCRDNEGGVEVGLALGRIQMNNFTSIMKKYLSDITNLNH
ncbi:hypothetical protein L6164_013189 [Bauhinia variegata]|uniref:Uncharacterized protein n=1 Tax=Bauhinia variegata TaxID=167791 RepID=A0ACB9PBB2_BAUVA|nr:hypothetical protein L6164_013189 [Bauhinia variegata]